MEYNEDEVVLHLTKNEFITQIREEIAKTRQKRPVKLKVQINDEIVSKNDEDEDTGEDEISTSESEIKDDLAESEESSVESEEENDKKKNFKKRTHQESKIINKKVSRLRLDDALANVSDMEGWSEARIRAYQGMKKNPNAYFYRFNAPGETQRNGPWSKEEEELFMRRVTEVGADGQWGLFSTAIPGRVGYQVKQCLLI